MEDHKSSEDNQYNITEFTEEGFIIGTNEVCENTVVNNLSFMTCVACYTGL